MARTCSMTDIMLYALRPHMHYRGKAFRFTAIYPDGNSRSADERAELQLRVAADLSSVAAEVAAGGHTHRD